MSDELKEYFDRAKSLYGQAEPNSSVAKAIENIFPQLRISEDERIRRHIINILNNLAPCHFDGNEKLDCINYLERQRGPLSKEEEYVLNRIIEYIEDNDCPSEWKSLLLDIHNLPYFTSNGDATVAPWTATDERIREALIHIAKEYRMKWTGVNGVQLEDVIDWLTKRGDIIRKGTNDSVWISKPTENELNALKNAAKHFGGCDPDDWEPNLESLYIRLKQASE